MVVVVCSSLLCVVAIPTSIIRKPHGGMSRQKKQFASIKQKCFVADLVRKMEEINSEALLFARNVHVRLPRFVPAGAPATRSNIFTGAHYLVTYT